MKAFVYVVIAAVGLIIITSTCSALNPAPYSLRSTPTPEFYVVTYEVYGIKDGYYSVTYETESEDTAQISSVKSGWRYDFKARPGQFVYIAGQNQQRYGDVICEIWVNHKMVKQTVSSGEYVIATCSGSL